MPNPHHRSRRRVTWLAGLSVVCAVVLLGQSQASASALRRTAIVQAVAEAGPSVVNIHGRKVVRSENTPYATNSDTFRQVNGMGTGVVIDERGYIITNYHVVQDVARIQVTMLVNKPPSADKSDNEQRTLVARLINHDPQTDLAIIKVDLEEKLPVIKIGTSSDLMRGEPVIAVGNAYGYDHTVTRGIISALHRTVQVSDDQAYDNLIQTDASINPGNSGGPLLNIDGQMIGINVAVRVGAQGIGFAIPIDEAMEVAARLLSAEQVGKISHGVTGKTTIEGEQHRFVVTQVRPDSPAANIGLEPGDVITSAQGLPVRWALDFERALLGHEVGDEIALEIERDAQPLAMNMVVGEAAGTTPNVQNRHWEVLGVQLAPLPANVFRQFNSRYNGGLKVVAVRGDGPAAKQGIRRGDVLVGMHIWETTSLDNVDYILSNAKFDQTQPVKFYILRGNETLYGHMRVATTPRR